MTDAELEVLAVAQSGERAHLLWVAACRRYRLIGEFAEEVVRERFLTVADTVTHDDFDAFLRAKAIWHEEIARLKDSTTRKLRANVFATTPVDGPLAVASCCPAPPLLNPSGGSGARTSH